MGRSTTPTFIMNYRDQLGMHTAAWDPKINGQPTDANLERWRKVMNKSMAIGGCNEHISIATGFVPHISEARIRNQKTGNLNVAYTKMPMFEVI